MSESEEGPEVGPGVQVKAVLGIAGVRWSGSKWRWMFMLASGLCRLLLFLGAGGRGLCVRSCCTGAVSWSCARRARKVA